MPRPRAPGLIQKNLLRWRGTIQLVAMIAGTLPTAYATDSVRAPDPPTLTLTQLRARYGDRVARMANIDGIDVYYKDEGSGAAILLVHESASSMTTFDEVVPRLRHSYRVIRYDVPGQGLSGDVSDTPADPVDTSKMHQPPEFVDAQREAKETHFQTQRFWDLFLTYFSGEPARMTPRIRREFYDFNRRAPNANALALVAKVSDHAKAVDAMSRVLVPTLLVWGARDPLLTPPAADALAGYLTQASVSKLMMPDVGHFPPLEVPVRFAAIVTSYVEAVTPVPFSRQPSADQ